MEDILRNPTVQRSTEDEAGSLVQKVTITRNAINTVAVDMEVVAVGVIID